MEKTGNRFKSFLINLLLLLIALFLTLAALEIVFRMFLRDSIVLFPRYHSEVKYGEYTTRRLRPNTVFWHTSIDGSWKFETNNQGYRDESDFTYRKDPETLRIVVLGDSHTEGFEVHQDRTYAAVLENYLKKRDIRTEVYNMGVSGFGSDEELILLENEVVKYKPDIVILGFFANDYEDNLKTGLFGFKGNRLIAKKMEHIPAVRILDFINNFYLIRKLSENSYLYSYSFNTVWDFLKNRNIRQAKSTEIEKENKQNQKSFAVQVSSRITDQELKLTELLLKRMNRFCRERDIDFILLEIPRENGKPSLEQVTYDKIEDELEIFVDGEKLLRPYRGLTDLNAPHGHHHISEYAHLIIGVDLGKQVEKIVNQSGKPE